MVITEGQAFFVEATDPRRIDEELNQAVDAAIQYPIREGRHGILVTRTGYTTFTVVISGRVPYGDLGGNRARRHVGVRVKVLSWYKGDETRMNAMDIPLPR
ncbi:hypothetical protein SAMN04487917_11353 [Arthrobacter sp. yr096]|uniref:hypothetical protein n=1 Tax=Arthrobacter sp. yr096 TaxID=1761750 RepID=UPI0008D81F06|nr:hypothetical protein [Arthrobacter sp. yr096]SEJ77983.1 hypothetical protein SAMN04487917_11353 [Arthrobacter sp. yr096]